MLFYFACEAAGASAPGIPHALPMGMAENSRTTRAHSRRENADTRDPHSVIAREGGRSSIAEELMINREAAAYWIPAFAGMTIGRACKSGPLRMRAQANVTRRVIAREGGRSSIAEELMINREAAAYWIPAFAGMTIGRGCKSGRLRMRAQANVTRRVIAREGGRSSIAEELMINREAAAYWIPAFAGMTIGRACKSGPLRMRAQANVTRRVIAREGGRSSIAEEPMINREAAAYWIPAFAGMSAGLRRTRVVCACERSEAIQLLLSLTMDCFAALA